MNIIFFKDNENVIFKCAFSGEDHFGFFDKSSCSVSLTSDYIKD